MAFCDFVVRYNPEIDTPLDLTERILYSIIIKRMKANKPAICFVGGDSGEGKSLSVISLFMILYKIQGLDFRKYFKASNVFQPLEYPEKIDDLLFNKEYKKANLICIHEARELVKAKMWQSFLTQSVGDINAMSRSLKRLCVVIISQFIRDITTDIRYTLNFYMIVKRPKGKKARLYINIMWKDDRDLEKPKLRKRKLSGYLVDKEGRYRRYVPQYLEMNKPPKDITDLFEKLDKEAKGNILRNKLDKLMQEMKSELGLNNNKVDSLVTWYSDDLTKLQTIGKQWRGKWKLTKEAAKMHNLSKDETKIFETKIHHKLIENKVLIE